MTNRTKSSSSRALKRFALILAVAATLLLSLFLFACGDANTSEPDPGNIPSDDPNDDPGIDVSETGYEYKVNTQVGFSGTVAGTTARVKPVADTKNEGRYFGNEAYPTYGRTLASVVGNDPDGTKAAARTALINESSYLTATGTANAGGGGYTWMDKDGYLYSGKITDNPQTPALEMDGVTRRQLYKHTAAVGLYLGDVSDAEPGIVKTVTMRPRKYSGYGVTGLYAPAGEVIKIEMSEADMTATGGIVIHIGQALYNGQANNIWTAKGQMQRIPHLLNTMVVSKDTAELNNGVYTAYVGSFIGGPIYIRNENVTFSATISGGVAYSHFILGYTTPSEFEKNSRSTAPYFDLEVWDRGVLHSGPVTYAKNYSYDDLYKAAVLWDKVSSVTTYGSYQGIVFLYDPFVAAGAAVAFPGRRSVNCPLGWMSQSLNYNGIVTSGSWGNFHEYHHNFQGYGVGNGGEVTNNGMTLVSYALFTKISSKRGMLNYGSQGLGGWNSYTSATWALEEVLKIARPDVDPSNGNMGLSLYATLLHNFGADAYMQAKVAGGGQSYEAYKNAWQNVTHNNMTYYFNDLLCGNVTNNADPSYPMFVPVSSVYQTGRSYLYDGEKKYFKTMQPFVIPYGEAFDIDLTQYHTDGTTPGGSIVLPDGFTYTVKSVSQPEHGSITKIDEKHYTYVPNTDDKSMFSGEIVVTLGITKTDGAFTVADVDLVLEFEQTHEAKKLVLNRTTYTLTDGATAYTDAQAAYEGGFNGYTKTTYDHSNPVQNANTDIWFYPNTPENHAAHPDAPDHHFVRDNTIDVLDGKLYFEEKGKYRIYLRGRLNCAMYYSLDGGETYVKGATIKDVTAPRDSSKFRPGDPNTYVDLELEAHSWVYVREIVIVQSSPSVSYIGLGFAKWTEPMFTIREFYYNANNEAVESPASPGYDHTVTKYYDYLGNEVTAEQANSAELMPPSNTAQPAYVNAYRSSYELPDNNSFKSDYFYTRAYDYEFEQTSAVSSHSLIEYTNFNAGTYYGKTFGIENLFDGNPDGMWNREEDRQKVNPDNPFTMTVDAQQTVIASSMSITGRHGATPGEFKLFVGDSVDALTEVTFTDAVRSGTTGITVKFAPVRFRYYKLVVTRTIAGTGQLGGNFLTITSLTFSYAVEGGSIITPDSSDMTYTGGWTVEQQHSTFGHVYVGKDGAQMTYEFTGTGFKILSSKAHAANFTVFVDDEEVQTTECLEDDGRIFVSFASGALAQGKHTLKIVCTGDASIDSIVVLP